MTEEEKTKKENEKRMLIALAILLGADIENNIEDYSSIPDSILKEAKELYKAKNLDVKASSAERLAERDIQIEMANIGVSSNAELYKIVGVTDDHTCKDCAKWQGTTVSMHSDGTHKTVQEFINEHGFHINCRCSLQPLDVDEIRLSQINPRYEERAAANPRIYNSSIDLAKLVLN